MCSRLPPYAPAVATLYTSGCRSMHQWWATLHVAREPAKHEGLTLTLTLTLTLHVAREPAKHEGAQHKASYV